MPFVGMGVWRGGSRKKRSRLGREFREETKSAAQKKARTYEVTTLGKVPRRKVLDNTLRCNTM